MSKGLVINFHKEEDSDKFEKVLVALKNRYNIISAPELDKILKQNGRLNNLCHLTFDDGERTFYDIVFPILKKHGVPASLFLSPKITLSEENFWFQDIELWDSPSFKKFVVDKLNSNQEQLAGISLLALLKCVRIEELKRLITLYKKEGNLEDRVPQNMNVSEVLEVDKSGLVTVGAHTVNHPILKNESDEDSNHEIETSIHGLEQILGHPVKYFAYPNGIDGLDFGDREIECLKKNNISIAFATTFDHLSSNMNFYKIPRMFYPEMLGLSPGHPLLDFRLALGKKWRSLRSNPPTEIEMRRLCMSLLKDRKTVPDPDTNQALSFV